MCNMGKFLRLVSYPSYLEMCLNWPKCFVETFSTTVCWGLRGISPVTHQAGCIDENRFSAVHLYTSRKWFEISGSIPLRWHLVLKSLIYRWMEPLKLPNFILLSPLQHLHHKRLKFPKGFDTWVCPRGNRRKSKADKVVWASVHPVHPRRIRNITQRPTAFQN